MVATEHSTPTVRTVEPSVGGNQLLEKKNRLPKLSVWKLESSGYLGHAETLVRNFL